MPKTVSTQLNGGLGNQLFQFATGLYIAELTDRELEIDVSRVSRDRTVRQRSKFGLAQLGLLGLSLHVGRITNRSLVTRYFSLNAIYRKLPVLINHEFIDFSPNGETGIGDAFSMAKIQEAKSEKIVVRGNMQYLEIALSVSKKYLSTSDLLRDPSDLFMMHKDFLSKNKVLSIHIRLRDYVTLEDSTQLTYKYYSDAISRATQLNNYDQIWIFSDDIASARLFMNAQILGSPITYHEEKALNDCETLVLMSLSHSIISANSTFSLWSCILSQSSHKFVPSPWFKNAEGKQSADFNYPSDWKAIKW